MFWGEGGGGWGGGGAPDLLRGGLNWHRWGVLETMK